MISMWMSGSSCCDLLGVYIDIWHLHWIYPWMFGFGYSPGEISLHGVRWGALYRGQDPFWPQVTLVKEVLPPRSSLKRSKLPHFLCFCLLVWPMKWWVLLQADIPTKFCRSCRSALARSWGIESLQRVYLNPCRSLGLWRNVAKSETVESEGLPSTKSLWEWVLNLLWASDWGTTHF